MSNPSNGIPKIEPEEIVVPGLGIKGSKKSEFDMSKYNARVGRFVLSDNLDDLAMLESLLTRGMNANDDSIILIDKKDSFFQDVYTTVLLYLERKAT